MELLPSDPFVLTLPANATVNSAGEVVANLTPEGSGAALDDFSNVTASVGRAALGVPATTEVDLKADIHLFATRECNLINTATGSTYSFIPLFDGAFTSIAFVLDGVTTADGAASVDITIGGAPVVLGSALSAPIASAAGFNVRTGVSSGGAFSATQIVTITTTSANTAATFGTVSLAGTRA